MFDNGEKRAKSLISSWLELIGRAEHTILLCVPEWGFFAESKPELKVEIDDLFVQSRWSMNVMLFLKGAQTEEFIF